MNTKILGLILAVCVAAGAACFAANPQMGTWKLNEAKSKIAPGTAKYTTVVYEEVGDKVKVTVTGVDGKGKAARNQWTGKFDGKDYPVVGDPTSDARSYKTRDNWRADFNVMNHGRVVGSGHIIVSADGKTRAVTTSGTDRDGKPFKNISVYNKQ